MFDMLNIYQQQMDLISRMQPVCIPETTQAQRIVDIVNNQMRSIQDIAGIQSNIANFVHPLGNFTISQEAVKLQQTLFELQQQFNSINRIYENLNISQLYTIAQSFSIPKSVFDDFSQSISISQINNVAIMWHSILSNIPDSVYDTILDGEYTKQEAEDEISAVENESSNFSIEGLTPEEVQKKLWKHLWEKHPKLASVLVKMLVVLAAISTTREITSFLEDVVIPAAQTAIVYVQEKENTYFVKVESARIYDAPNSHASRITNVLYGDEVYKLEDIKLWVKVSYKTTNGEEITGWIAKRNLMPYRDYEFNSDELYE